MEKMKEREMFLNPYVIQMDKFADSLRKLSNKFLKLETYKSGFSEEEYEEIYGEIIGKVCEGCGRKRECVDEKDAEIIRMLRELLDVIEEYGAEINIETKRKLQKECQQAPRLLREALEVYENAKHRLSWNNKMVRAREGYAEQLNCFTKAIQYTTRELDAGLFEDVHLQKRLKTQLKKCGIKMLSSVFYITEEGKYEIHLTVKAMKGYCVPTKDFAAKVGNCIGRIMIPEHGERPIIGGEYTTIACIEGAKYYTLQGIARIGKGCEKISGDTFLLTNLPGGKKGIALSDGMGAGEHAFRESAMVVEMLEELLEAGFSVKTAIEMMNTVLVIGREEMKFSTIDVCIFDLYTARCEMVKAGASVTFIKRKDMVEQIFSETLPVGVLQEMNVDVIDKKLNSGDFVIMVTDGVMDALPVGEQEKLMKKFIMEAKTVNPTEFAHYLIGKVLEVSGEIPTDDMTILVMGIWEN